MREEDSLTIPGRYEQIQEVCEFVASGAQEAGFDEDTIFQLQLATDEACTNVIEHAYGGEGVGNLRIDWRINGHDFAIIIHDNGRSFNPEDVPAPSGREENNLDLRVGGLGLYFMRNLMDKVSFQFNESHGNILTMTKRLPDKEAS